MSSKLLRRLKKELSRSRRAAKRYVRRGYQAGVITSHYSDYGEVVSVWDSVKRLRFTFPYRLVGEREWKLLRACQYDPAKGLAMRERCW